MHLWIHIFNTQAENTDLELTGNRNAEWKISPVGQAAAPLDQPADTELVGAPEHSGRGSSR